MKARWDVGDRVVTPDGPGEVWRIWTETSWSFGVPHTVTRSSVKLDPPAKGWIKVYDPDDVELDDGFDGDPQAHTSHTCPAGDEE